jgi:hypothetical protein
MGKVRVQRAGRGERWLIVRTAGLRYGPNGGRENRLPPLRISGMGPEPARCTRLHCARRRRAATEHYGSDALRPVFMDS